MSQCPVPLSEHEEGEHELDLTRSGFGGSVYCRTCNRYIHPESRSGGVPYEERGGA